MFTFKNLPISLFFLSAVLQGFVGANNCANFLTHSCSGRVSYAQGGAYEANLNLLLSNLRFNSQLTMYYNLTVGETTTTVYGHFLCRGDTTPQVCHDCVMAATTTIKLQCHFDVAAMVWYEECILRYSDRSMFGIPLDNPVYYFHLGPSSYEQFNYTIFSTLGDLIFKAAFGNSSLAFSSTVVNVTSSLALGSYAECTPDINDSGCNKCLEAALGRLQTFSSGDKYAVLLQPSCRLRYNFNSIVAASDTPPSIGPSNSSDVERERLKRKVERQSLYVALLAALCSASMLVHFSCLGFYLHKQMVKRVRFLCKGVDDMEKVENLQFDFDAINQMTDNFSEANQIGGGGFGVVYKGCLPNGQAIAVKRLSSVSNQGSQEFKTEASFLAKLQHRNLVKLYGFCVNSEEKLLVYEYLPNKSLDRFLSDPSKVSNLSWETRYKIILGVARGLQYLHEDSRFRIIHRDLKSSNILLDADFNPKISDFGLAKLFELHQTQGNTSTVVGTYGYMAPEYAKSGQYSTKSDVYSFGIILLELLSGRMRCSSFLLEEGFLFHAWSLWSSGKSSEFFDSTIIVSDSIVEASRCIHIGLLCVQEDPSKRPDMGSVVTMLNSPSITLPLPMAPSSNIWMSSSSTSSSTTDGVKDASTSQTDNE